jgi:hypothetical protein
MLDRRCVGLAVSLVCVALRIYKLTLALAARHSQVRSSSTRSSAPSATSTRLRGRCGRSRSSPALQSHRPSRSSAVAFLARSRSWRRAGTSAALVGSLAAVGTASIPKRFWPTERAPSGTSSGSVAGSSPGPTTSFVQRPLAYASLTFLPGRLIEPSPHQGVKLYDAQSQRLLSFIDRPADAPRADLFKPSLTFITPPPNVSPVHQPTQLIVSWADTIKLVRIRTRTSTATSRPSSLHGAVLPPGGGSTQTTGASHTTLHVEITAILQLDAPMAGLVPYKDSFLVFAYLAPEEKDASGGFYDDDEDEAEALEEQEPQRPELRIVSRKGEELSSDALGLEGWLKWRCSDYALIPLPLSQPPAFVVLSPKEVVVARERDDKDRVEWLVERRRYEEALDLVERLGKEGRGEGEMTVRGIGEKFLDSLVHGGACCCQQSVCVQRPVY